VSGQRSLARVSKTPGRTQRVHFFRGRAGLALVDLPGYGFARASNEIRARLASAADSYLTTRENLRALVLLMDVRRDPEREERMLAELAASRELELILVATKIDKLGRADRERRMRALPSALAGSWLEFSSLDRTGADDLVRAIERIERIAGGRRR